jgi:hypothetical protein
VDTNKVYSAVDPEFFIYIFLTLTGENQDVKSKTTFTLVLSEEARKSETVFKEKHGLWDTVPD